MIYDRFTEQMKQFLEAQNFMTVVKCPFRSFSLSFEMSVLNILLCSLPLMSVNCREKFVDGEELDLFDFLVQDYDQRMTPRDYSFQLNKDPEPLLIKTNMFVYFIGNFEAQNLEFETHLLFRFQWRVSFRRFQKSLRLSFVTGQSIELL